MDVASVASAAVGMQSAQVMEQVQVAMLRKAMDSQQSVVAQLVQALPPPSPPGTGVRLDTYA